jgi:hypothetical protein
VENLAEVLEQWNIAFVYISPYLVVQFRDLNSFSGVFTTFMGPWGLQNLGTERVDRGLLGGQRIQSLQGGN